ncbi:MAG TPA: helix-turn-helix domain-containing protein [Stellaceae bacterium]
MQAGLSFAMLEAGLRGAAVALGAVLAVLLLRDGRRTPAGLYGALFAASVAAYIIVTAPGLLFYRPLPWLVPLRLVSLGTPAIFWLFALAAFDDAFVASWRHALPWLGTVAIGFVCARGLLSAACPLYHALQLLFVVLAIRQALVGRSADLVEERRRFRVALVLASAIYTAAVIVLETFMGGPPASPPLSTINAAGVLALTFVFVFTQLSLSTRGQLIPVAPVMPRGLPVDASPRSDAAPIDDQETALLERLRRLMEQEKIYREEGLSVAVLADKLSLPEYRLRRLINRRLGHRNFSTFVNAYRLTDAMVALGDPGQAGVPVVTIALDAGFQSLGPFNRAFKAHTGMTPTDYRRLQLGRTEKPA